LNIKYISIYHICSLVRTLLEYGDGVWSLYTLRDIRHIDKVQNHSLNFASYLVNIFHSPHDYINIVMCLVLNCYRNTSSCCFINELIEGNTDVPRLLERLNIRVTSNTKFKGLFYQPVNHTNFANNSSLIRMILIANSNL